jgi:hypothetical protein
MGGQLCEPIQGISNLQSQIKRLKKDAPPGHIGKTRPIPDNVDNQQVIAPPDICPHCGGTDIVPKDDFISKYIEDFEILATVLETCRLKRKNLSDFIHSVWLTPKDQLLDATRALLDTS